MYLAQFTQAVALLASAKIPILNCLQLTKEMIDFYPLQTALSKVENTIMVAFAIPRGVSVLASGGFEILNNDSNEIIINVSAKLDTPNPGIVQSQFMLDNAKTTKFIRALRISADTLSYTQETTVEIYDKTFAHTDENSLTRN